MDDIPGKPTIASGMDQDSAETHAMQTLRPALTLWLDLIAQAGGWSIGHAWLPGAGGGLRSSGFWCFAEPMSANIAGRLRAATEASGFDPSRCLPGQCVRQGVPILADKLDALDGFSRKAEAHAAGLNAAYAFPIHTAKGVPVVLEFFAAQARPPSQALLDTIADLGQHLTLILQADNLASDLPRNLSDRRQILDAAGEAFVGMDADDRITEWNKKAEATFGWARSEVLGHSVTETIIPPAYREDHRQGIARFVRTEVPKVLGKRMQMEALHKDGRVFPIEITQWALKSRDGWHFYAFIEDITERKRIQRELEWLAYYDHLTGLPNRSLLLDRLGTWLDKRPQDTAVFFLGLDHFKWINESFGYTTGNQVLKAIGQRLCSAVAVDDLVARIAADEFVVVTRAGSAEATTAMAERILSAVATPLELDTDRIFLTAGIGYATADAEATPDSLLRAADIALSRAKQLGRGQCAPFQVDMQSSAHARLNLEKELSEALEQDQLRLYFQPIVDSRRETLVALEALLRWEHPERGLVSPLDFIPLAEETGLIVPIGTWVLREAHRWASRWESQGLLDGPLHISVNLSARQLAQSNLIATVRQALAQEKTVLRHARIGMEVTESVVMRNPIDAARTMQALRQLGMHLSIDDFGTGYSSLAYLKQFPVNVLKIDISFVRHVVEDEKDRAIVRAIAQLAKALGLAVVAEGVETREQRDVLRGMDVDYLQGYLYSRPVPGDELNAFLSGPALLVRD